jgi:hypothetical protein
MTDTTPQAALLPCSFCEKRRANPIIGLAAELRSMADVADIAGKGHWAKAMREASRQIIRAENIEAAAKALSESIESLSADRVIPIASAHCALADALACPF